MNFARTFFESSFREVRTYSLFIGKFRQPALRKSLKIIKSGKNCGNDFITQSLPDFAFEETYNIAKTYCLLGQLYNSPVVWNLCQDNKAY